MSVRKRNDSMSAETRCTHIPSIAWKVATVVWALVIFYLSTGAFALNSTGRFALGGLGLVHLTIPAPSFWALHIFVRKAAHVIEYAIFAILLCESSEEPPFPWRQRRFLACLLIVAVYSLTDEYHQHFVAGRTASLTDCGIDSVEGAVGILLYYFNSLRLQTICRAASEASHESPGQNGCAAEL